LSAKKSKTTCSSGYSKDAAPEVATVAEAVWSDAVCPVDGVDLDNSIPGPANV